MSDLYQQIEEKFATKDHVGAMALIDYGLAQNSMDLTLMRSKARLYYTIRQLKKAEDWYTATINHSSPIYSDFFGRASVRYETSDYPGAIRDLDIAELIDDSKIDLYLKRGGSHWEMRDWDKAFIDFERALKLDPNHPNAIWINGLLDLQLGKFNTGWERYNARWKSERFKSKKLETEKPEWTPESGLKRVLVWGEQGMGDQILYSSMLPHLKSLVDKVTVITDERLIPLLKRSMPDADFLPKNAEVPVEDHDSHLPIANIGAKFVRSINDISKFAARRFFTPDPKRVEEIRGKMGEGFVALSWTSAGHIIGRHKSIALETLEPILNIPDVRFVNVQYVRGGLEQQSPRVIDSGIDCKDDIEGLAALLSLSKCLISVSSSTLHLAGALGVPTLLMDANKLWYWGNRDENNMSYWYPSVKIFPRDNVLAPWDNVVEAVKQELIGRLNDHR